MGDGFNASQPIYQQLVARLCRQIVRGELKPGEKLPSVREMAVQAGVNPNTVQRVYSEMERMGIVEARRGQGSFVTENTEELERLRVQLKVECIGEFVKDMKEMGFSSAEIIEGIEKYLKQEK
ncbi:GntR family transcriptional regulator [Aneurinibacillus aneurinilyticus]|jgi:GntR family transcriptional regulator|uniref:GntR family transcriptional regulator n=2 Tax=Aneurinibacillus aneurinilyticus TaxID=1391 RepID=A0A848CPJ9_ANEAE|nr:GntR family transcriptional regulator [Aneurinibacillus aneurinilyticus]ERI08118.1 transcriptional regulator, GntR family [Aneurinibacillus aneurinilyticus ATCC 12856]MCI1696872.1 GntR family transcriptional regulator [Aneurinibacillus aneurinilyticus]MED0669597.1 GntR family transcriptional regulator [Aneurinibacillus aneurinilyticus]MED0709361.1 GntR family transcriptional regulator [Aneurinibacillus aneurinilyticus]MED0726447.1 GntR family transcriptional regulator [Aneurinibacillus aneu